jgi:hypothetical protein
MYDCGTMFDNIENHGRPRRSPLRGGGTGMMYVLRYGVDFDFNILTAFIRLGRAGPRRGPGALHIIIF